MRKLNFAFLLAMLTFMGGVNRWLTTLKWPTQMA